MPIVINGSFTGAQAVSSSFSQNAIQAESANENNNQAQAAAKGQKGGNTKGLQSLSNSAIEGNIANDNDTCQITGLSTDVCDFNILPYRTATIESAGAWQATGANQINAQAPNPSLQQTDNLGLNISTAIPTVSSPVTTYPNPGVPFRVEITGSDALPFAGSSSSTKSAGGTISSMSSSALPAAPTVNSFAPAPAQTNSAMALLSQMRAKRNAVQTASSFAVQGSVSREHSIGQDGRVLLEDVNGNPLNPADPTAAPGYDPVTNTAPGRASYAVYSGDVKVPSLFIPGPVPGDPNASITPPTRNSVRGNIKLGSSSAGQVLASRGRGSQLQNQSALGTIGSFNSSVFSLIGIG